MPSAQMKHASEIRVLGLAGTLFLAACLAGDDALATCGDYVTTGHAMAGGLHKEAIHKQIDAFDGAIPVHRPCQGPNCSRRSVPLSVPPVMIPSHSHDWMLPAVALCDFSVEPLDIVQVDSSPHPRLRAGVIFRPPRST